MALTEAYLQWMINAANYGYKGMLILMKLQFMHPSISSPHLQKNAKLSKLRSNGVMYFRIVL